MDSSILPLNQDTLDKAKQILKSGGVVAIPTDTLYGIAADLYNENAIQKLYEIKGRDNTNAIAVLIGRNEDLSEVSSEVSGKVKRLISRYWPGPLTVVVKKKSKISSLISKDNTIGVRIPNHKTIKNFLVETGPLAVTSANLSGGDNLKNAQEILEVFEDKVDLIINDGEVKGGIGSTVVNCTSEDFKILREGSISEQDILE